MGNPPDESRTGTVTVPRSLSVVKCSTATPADNRTLSHVCVLSMAVDAL
jgi:hypothetical protein